MRVAVQDLLIHDHNQAAMCQSHVDIRRCEPQPSLNSLLLSETFPQSTYLARTLELTMLHLQEYRWTSKTRLTRKHQADKQPHGLGTLLNRG